jgi:hypothetical protein
VVCGKNTEVKTGWHLKYGLDFCSDRCVASYVEILYRDIQRFHRKISNHERRIAIIEESLGR